MNVLIKEELQYLLLFNHAYFQSVIIRWSLFFETLLPFSYIHSSQSEVLSLSGSFLQKGGRRVEALSLFDVPVIEIVASRNRQKEFELNSCPR
jgi:hypothetical protein